MRTILAVGLSLLLTGCVSAPPVEFQGVEVTAIVQRVKCEIAVAIPRRQGEFPTGPFQWLMDWTVKVDLTLETTDTSGLNASMSFLEPSKLFTLGTGASFTGTAYRNDKLSFTVALHELETLRARDCALPERRGLLGNLGLGEWIASALTPVGLGKLKIGFHQQPPGKSGGKLTDLPSVKSGGDEPPGPQKTPLGKKKDQWEANKTYVETNIVRALSEGEDYVERARGPAADAQQFALCSPDSWKHTDRARDAAFLEDCRKLMARFGRRKNEMQRAYDAARDALDKIELATAQFDAVKLAIWRKRREIHDLKGEIKAVVPADGNEKAQQEQLVGEIDKYMKEKEGTGPWAELSSRIKEAGEQAGVVSKAAKAAWDLLPHDTPLDSIAHSIKFTVTANVNASPNWNLVRFKGPSGNNPFLSAQRQRIHTLELVLGAPGTPGGKDLSDEQRRQLFNMRLDELRASGTSFVPVN
jgi:hypothetical protein